MPPANEGSTRMRQQSMNASSDSDRSLSNHRGHANDANSNLYVGGLHDSVHDADLAHRFQLFGPVVSAKVMLHIHTGQSRGIGFVKFETRESAVAAIQALHRSMFHGQRIMVRFADSRADFRPGDKTNKIFVRNLPFDVNVTTLRNHFQQFGPINECTLHLDTAGFKAGGNGVRTRMAYISFDSVEHAELAAATVHGTRPFASCHAAVMAKLAESDAKRHERRQQVRDRQQDTDVSESAPSPTDSKLHGKESDSAPSTVERGYDMPTSDTSRRSRPSPNTSDPASSDSGADSHTADVPSRSEAMTRTAHTASPSSGSAATPVVPMLPPVGPIRIPLPTPSATTATPLTTHVSQSAPPQPSAAPQLTSPVANLTAATQMLASVLPYGYAAPGYPYAVNPAAVNPTAFLAGYPSYLGGFAAPPAAMLPSATTPMPGSVYAAGLPGMTSLLGATPAQPPMLATYPGYTPNPYVSVMPPGLPSYPTSLPPLPMPWPY